jgi:hypothetical protein
VEEKYIGKLAKAGLSSKIKILLVIARDGRLLTIKGKFDNMKVGSPTCRRIVGGQGLLFC